ncbi:4-diphosphocytidyl-2C-methyl-D-erythritol kinase [Methylobacterium sp. Leaf123]|uniref:nucleotidyltransferase family protein n=1 Tax=Methylobacterium sp. Leaf123 TaxID=1736264 RepID=UPI000701183C|nr:nucleotidyltransferase family protein [Methylobacterium sp. Leaf123]KQQ11732.1 4-diphosphocytidyl-2C-methyl-D-erythritol kinase [Methylobacterium sp. Leaf123]
MMGSEPRIGAVLLAAGLGSRFGQAAKMLAPYAGRPMVRRAAEAALASHAGPVVAVLGAHAEAVRAALAGLDLRLVENPDPAAGLSTSLRIGLAALPPGTEAALVLLGDMPRIGPAHLDALIAAYAGAMPRPSAVVPVSEGRRGNPVLLNLVRLGADLAALTGDHGAGPILKRRGDVLELPADPAVIFDVDTPEALGG